MLVKDVIGECLVKMGKPNFLSDDGATPEPEEQALADRLLAAFNIAYRRAATDYIPFYAEESVEATDGVIPASALGHAIIYPVSLRANGVNHAVTVCPSGLATELRGKGTLRYAYLPPSMELDDEVTDMRLTPAVLSDGALGEYYAADKVFALAEAYGESFRDALRELRYKGRAWRLGGRRKEWKE